MPTTAPLTIVNATPLGVTPDGWVQFAPAIITAGVAVAAFIANWWQFRYIARNWEEEAERAKEERQYTIRRNFIQDYTQWATNNNHTQDYRRFSAVLKCGVLLLDDEDSIGMALEISGQLNERCRLPEMERIRQFGFRRFFQAYEKETKGMNGFSGSLSELLNRILGKP